MSRLRPAEIARRAGVHRSTVSRQLRLWPHLLDEAGTVDLDEYLAARASELDPALQSRGPAAVLGSARPNLIRDRARKMAAEAELAEIEIDVRRGQLIDRQAAARAVEDAFRRLRDRILAAARDVVPHLARITDERDIESRLRVAIGDALAAIHVEFRDDAAAGGHGPRR